ncbi:MAG: bacteriophage holin [Candidatus Binataceae bacterium]
MAVKFDVRAFSIAVGLIWGFGVFFLTWWVIAFEGATHELTLLGHLYRGYDISPAGSLIGLLWALPDGLIGGAIFAWLYNLLARNSAATRRQG